MPAKKATPVATPLELLAQLSHSLVEHLDQACRKAVADAEALLAKLEKQRGKAQEKLAKARGKLDEAGGAGKPRAQAKARERVGELEESLVLLQARQSETLGYIAQLKRDVTRSLELARGVSEVGRAASVTPAAAAKPAARAPRRAAAPRSRKPAAEPSAAVEAPAAKVPRKSATAKQTRPAAAAASKPATARKPTTRKPAAAKPAAVAASAEATAQPAGDA
jgi:hypothetical protein